MQPEGYFEGCTHAGSLGGDDSVQDNITSIVTMSGDNGINYNFGEMPAGRISGLRISRRPANRHVRRQHPRQSLSTARRHSAPDDQRIGGVTLELRYTLTGEPVRGEDLLPGAYQPDRCAP